MPPISNGTCAGSMYGSKLQAPIPWPHSMRTHLHLQSVGHRTMLALLPPQLPPSCHPISSASSAAAAAAPLALSRARPVQALVLGATSELATEELRHAVDSAFRCGVWVWIVGRGEMGD